MRKTTVKVAPFDHRGNLLHWVSKESERYRGEFLQPGQPGYVEWRANDPFAGTLTLSGMESGMSAKYVIWKADDGRSFPMFVKDLVDFICRHKGTVDNGIVHARWMVSKRGANYGIRLAKEGE